MLAFARRRTSTFASAIIAQETPESRKVSIDAEVSAVSTQTQQQKRRTESLRGALEVATLVDAVYALVSVPLRIALCFDPWKDTQQNQWTHALTILTTLDLVGECIRFAFLVSDWQSLVSKQGNTRTSKRISTLINPLLFGRQASQPVLPLSALYHFSRINMLLLLLPCEFVAGFVDYNWIHIARIPKFLMACRNLKWLFSLVLKRNRDFHIVQQLSFSTLGLPFYLFWLGLYLCHVTACGYMFIAHYECGMEFTRCPADGSWVLRDKLEQGTFWRQYIRSMYWASKTVTTLGQGDLVPATIFETQYCIVVQYVSGLWATAFLSSCSFFFSCRDRDLDASVSTQLKRAIKFLQSRSIPQDLAERIRSYHRYILRTRNGIEQDRVLAHLPPHYQSQLSFHVISKLLQNKVSFFTKQPKAFIKTILHMVESDFLSPHQVVFSVNEPEEMLMIASGYLRTLSTNAHEPERVVIQGECYADHALFQDTRSKCELVAGTFCEIYCLPQQNFLRALELHYPKMRVSLILLQHRRSTEESERQNNSTQVVDRELLLSASLKKSDVLERAREIPWRYPNSPFRLRWRRSKLMFLIYLAIDVPYEIAFKWRFGVLNQETHWTHNIGFMASVVVELFFYCDVYLRSCRFVRTNDVMVRETKQSESSAGKSIGRSIGRWNNRAPRNQATALGLIVEPADIFRYYLDHDDVLVDFFATLPISMIWNVYSKDFMSTETMLWMRYVRLFAIGRLFQLKIVLKKLMVSLDFTPASQMLARVIIFCVVAANAMACCMYLISDLRAAVDGLPVDVNIDSLQLQACLEQASLYDNCTWFMFDYSHFAINFRYLRAMHWSLVLLSTVGYGDILSFSDEECFLGFWWIFLGALICYFTACAVSSVIAQVTILDTIQSDRLMEINRAFVRTGIPEPIRDVIREHYCTNWEFNGSVVQESALLGHLPRSLRHRLACALYLKDLNKCEIFATACYQTTFIRELALQLRSEIFLPNVILMEVGPLMSEMFLIQSGNVELLIQDDQAHSASRNSSVKFAPTHERSLMEHLAAKFDRSGGLSHAFIPTHATNVDRQAPTRKKMELIPWAVLSSGNVFAAENLLGRARFVAKMSARSVTTTQVAILTRDAFSNLSERFPTVCSEIYERIEDKKSDDASIVKTIKRNLSVNHKVRELLGVSRTLYTKTQLHITNVIAPESAFCTWWRALHGMIMIFNFYTITFRIAFMPNPSPRTHRAMMVADYLCDAVLYADIYLKWNRFGYMEHGIMIDDLAAIRKRYWNGWMRVDCLSLLPLYFQGDYYYMALERLPRLLKSPQLLGFVEEIEEYIRGRISKGRGSQMMLSIFDLAKFLVLFLSVGHHIGSLYFIIGRQLIEDGLVRSSWITVDVVLRQYPGDYMVQYIRSLYWCLETFTVVCFGDVIAQNALETIFASATCIMGWMCIAQVTGKITSLMAVLDKDDHEHAERVEDFEQYAKTTNLPNFLRERCIESLEYKTKCLVELNVHELFQDLPTGLHNLLYDALYGPYVRAIPELTEVLSEPQLQAFANALVLEVYLAKDTIIEEGRIGTKLFIMKEGRAHVWSSKARIAFAAVHKGELLGDTTFFLKGSRHMASVRAHTMCQVISLHRRSWMQLWPDKVRVGIENRLAETMRKKFSLVAQGYVNILHNLEARHGRKFSAADNTRIIDNNFNKKPKASKHTAFHNFTRSKKDLANFVREKSKPLLIQVSTRAIRKSVLFVSQNERSKSHREIDSESNDNWSHMRDLRKHLGLPRSADLWSLTRQNIVKELLVQYENSYNEDDGHSSWLLTPGMLSFSGCSGLAEVHELSLEIKYTRSYHFSMGAIRTVSYGDIAPQNAVETLAGIFVIVLSFVLFGMLSGGFFHVFEMELGQRADYEERVATVAQYMMFHQLQAQLWRQMQLYFAVRWQESKGMNEEQQLRGITMSVKQDISLYVKREFVSQLKLFATCEEAFMRAMVAAFEQELYVRNDVIISEGDKGRSLYVIETGSVLVRCTKKAATPAADTGAQVMELVKSKFDFFGEKSLILDVPRSATCIAMCTCRLLLLTVDKYQEILEEFPEYREKNTREWIFLDTKENSRPYQRRQDSVQKTAFS